MDGGLAACHDDTLEHSLPLIEIAEYLIIRNHRLGSGIEHKRCVLAERAAEIARAGEKYGGDLSRIIDKSHLLQAMNDHESVIAQSGH